MAELPQSLHARLRDDLRGRILDGEYGPGSKLPSESELIASQGVSRITVRQALGALQSEGLIVKLHGKGAFVSQPRAAQSLDRLQGLREALAPGHRALSSKRLVWREVKAPATVARQLGLPAGTTVHHLHTVRYLDRQPLSVNTSYLLSSLGERLARVDFSQRDLIDIFEHEGGLRIGEARLDIGAGKASARDAKLLHVEAGAAVLEVERLLHDVDGMPVHVETAVYRADAFRYQLNLRR